MKYLEIKFLELYYCSAENDLKTGNDIVQTID
jgi:hypothetical protein